MRQILTNRQILCTAAAVAVRGKIDAILLSFRNKFQSFVSGVTTKHAAEGTTMKFGSGKGNMKFGVEDRSVITNSNDRLSFSAARKSVLSFTTTIDYEDITSLVVKVC